MEKLSYSGGSVVGFGAGYRADGLAPLDGGLADTSALFRLRSRDVSRGFQPPVPGFDVRAAEDPRRLTA